MDLTEAEDIKKRWKEYTEELYKKGLHDPDNHYGVIIHLEPNIVEREVRQALGNITRNKHIGGDGILAEDFTTANPKGQCCDSAALKYARKFGKHSSGHGTGKGHFSFQSQRKGMLKNAQTTTQLHSSHMLAK